MIEGLRKIYGAGALADELEGKKLDAMREQEAGAARSRFLFVRHLA